MGKKQTQLKTRQNWHIKKSILNIVPQRPGEKKEQKEQKEKTYRGVGRGLRKPHSRGALVVSLGLWKATPKSVWSWGGRGFVAKTLT